MFDQLPTGRTGLFVDYINAEYLVEFSAEKGDTSSIIEEIREVISTVKELI